MAKNEIAEQHPPTRTGNHRATWNTDAGGGFENMTPDDYALPFLRLLNQRIT
jgi:hypothetical protein